MTIMEEATDTPVKDTVETCTEKVQDENVPMNDNGDFHNGSNNSNTDSINKVTDDKKSDVPTNPVENVSNKMETNEDDEDLEEGEISDDDEEELPKESVDTKSEQTNNKDVHDSNESSDHSDANVSRARPGEESDPSEREKKHGSSDNHRSKDKKSRRDKRSDRDLKKELQDDEAKKREIKEKIRELERQMKIDDEGEDEDDLEEMGILGVGGSPRENRKQRKRKSESDSNNENEQDRGERSRSRSPKRRKRDRDDHRRRRGRDQDDSKRGFGSGGFGSGFGRNAARGDKSSELCKLFMQGKCPKSPQNCLYSHNAEPPKIMELCKFYLLERCAKREKCLYLHKGFPCKYFHTGHRCMDDAESCKFSHGDLTDVTRTILLKHLEAAPKEILGDFPRLTREKALELVYKTEAKNKGWDTLDKSKEESQPKSAGDSFVEQQNMNQPNHRNDNRGFGVDERNRGPIKSMNDDNPKKSRWEADSTQREFEAPFMQNHPPPLMQPPPNYFRPPGPRGPVGGPFGPRGPIGMGFGQRGPNPGLGLLGQAPGVGNNPAMMGEKFSQNPFNQRDQPPHGSKPFGRVPPGYGDPGFGEDQVKTFLQAQRQGQDPSGAEQYPNRNTNRGPPTDEWNGPIIPAGPNSFFSQPPNENTSNPSKNRNSPDRERTPTPEDNMDFGEDSSGKSRKNEEKPISQRKVYEELQRKHKEKESRLESVKEPNPMFKEDNWYSSEEESEEKSDRSFSEENSKPSSNLKRKSPDGTASSEENTDSSNTQTSQHQIVKTTILSLRETPATPPPPPTLSDSDRNSMEASSAANNRVALPKELTQVLSSIKSTSPSTSFESNTSPSSMKRDPRTSRDPRQQSKNDPRMGRPASQSGSDNLSETEREREKEKDKRILEMDLSIFGDLDLPTFKDSEDNSTGNESPVTEEENALNLPFKPHKVHQVAKEIDASIYSHSPLEYRLRAIFIAKPDYSDMLIKQHIPASKVQQDPRLRRYSDKITGKLSSTSNSQADNRRYSDDGIEIMSPPGPTKAKGDPRRNKSQTTLKLNEQNTDQPEEENVYNPIKDLYSSRNQQPSQYPKVQHNDTYGQEVYSPTQDVQDMYSKKPKKQNNAPLPEDLENGVYNPRQDLNPNLKNSLNQGPPSGFTPLGPTGPWSGGPTGHPYSAYDNFYGGNNQNYDATSGDDRSFYNNPNNYDGMSGRGIMGNTPGTGMISSAPSRNGDPRTNRRDPRRKD